MASLLCIFLWVQDRSVFLDEANLIINIHELTYTQLTGPLLADQRAPLLFTWTSKLITSLVGSTTMAFRLFPLLLIVSSFWLFRSVVIKRYNNLIGLGILIIYGIHELLQKYGSECKQYSADIFSAVLLLFIYDRWQPRAQYIIKWITLGTVLIWLSMSSVLILAGIGISWLLKEKTSGFKNLKPIILIGTGWLIALAANYYMILSPAIDSDFMQNYHAKYFLDVTNWESIQRSFMVFIRLVAKKTAIGISAVIILLILGVVRLFSKDSTKTVVYLVPVILALLLSALGMYSLLERLVLFTLPLLLLIIAEGFTFINDKLTNKYFKWLSLCILSVGLLVSVKYRQGVKWIYQSPVEDLKTVLLDIHKLDNNPNILLSKHAYPSYYHYENIDELVAAAPYKRGSREYDILQEFEPLTKDTSWIILSHVLNMEEEVSKTKANYTLINELRSEGTVALQIVKSK